jgi:hypothetical protein
VRTIWAAMVAVCLLAATGSRPSWADTDSRSGAHVHPVLAAKTLATRRTPTPTVPVASPTTCEITFPARPGALVAPVHDPVTTPIALELAESRGARAPPPRA